MLAIIEFVCGSILLCEESKAFFFYCYHTAKSEEPLKVRWHRALHGKVTSLTVSKDSEQDRAIIHIIGIDLTGNV
jgi:hypothetical protein